MPPVYVRAYAARADGSPGEPIRFVASTSNVARDGLIVDAAGWQLDNYRKNPVFLWAHNYRDPPIGKAIDVRVEGDELIAEITFDQADERARLIEQKYRSGYLNAVSVGFDIEAIEPAKHAMAAPRATKAELLEISGVPVPSDPDALASRQRAAEQADAEQDWASVAADMTALYCFPLARPIRAWRASYHALARAYTTLGKEPPERLSPEYLATLDTEALAGLFLEDEAERCADVFARHAAERAAMTAVPPALRERLHALRDLCDALLQAAAGPPNPEPVPAPEPADADDAALAAAQRLLNRWESYQ
jgi:HK97 family phage prohead protease